MLCLEADTIRFSNQNRLVLLSGVIHWITKKCDNMNYILLCSIVASLLLLEFILLLMKRKKARKQDPELERKPMNKGSNCLELEDCWCCKYNLSGEEKKKMLKEFETLHCGKSVESMLKNK